MASVQFTWSDMWLKWYNLQDANVKREFLEQIELRQTISMSPSKMQIEMLECAPVEIKNDVKSVLHGNARKVLFEEEGVSTNDFQPDWNKLYQEAKKCQQN